MRFRRSSMKAHQWRICFVRSETVSKKSIKEQASGTSSTSVCKGSWAEEDASERDQGVGGKAEAEGPAAEGEEA